MNKKQLAVLLSRLEKLSLKNRALEQYETDPELAAQILWHASLHNDITNKVVADFGCGNGIFGIGALVLGAKKVYFIDVCDLSIAKKNVKHLGFRNASFLQRDISNFSYKVDVVFQNPPFGVQKKHADKIFLERAFNLAQHIYSIHKIESKSFLEQISKEYCFHCKKLFTTNFLLKKSFPFHRKKAYPVLVGCWFFEKAKALKK